MCLHWPSPLQSHSQLHADCAAAGSDASSAASDQRIRFCMVEFCASRTRRGMTRAFGALRFVTLRRWSAGMKIVALALLAALAHSTGLQALEPDAIGALMAT